MKRLAHGDDGAIAVVVAVSAVVLFGFAALVVDVGNAQDLKSQAQTALDSAALAAAQQLAVDPNVDVGDVVENIVDENLSDVRPGRLGLSNVDHPFTLHSSFWKSCVTQPPADYVTAADTPCISWDPAQATVAVRLPDMKVAVNFGGIAGVGSFHMHLASAAKDQPGESSQLCSAPDVNSLPVAAPNCGSSMASPSSPTGSPMP